MLRLLACTCALVTQGTQANPEGFDYVIFSQAIQHLRDDEMGKCVERCRHGKHDSCHHSLPLKLIGSFSWKLPEASRGMVTDGEDAFDGVLWEKC